MGAMSWAIFILGYIGFIAGILDNKKAPALLPFL
jgi:hypothetical protein